MKQLIRQWLCSHSARETVVNQEHYSVGGHDVIATTYESRCVACGKRVAA